MITKIAIWVRKMVINLEHFGFANVNDIEKLMSNLFGDNKASIQLRKSISYIGKIKYINTAFHQVKDESQKCTIFLQ